MRTIKLLLTIIGLGQSFISYSQNLVSSQSWTIGSGSVAGFSQNGNSSQNFREMGAGPYGTQVILWKAVADAANGADGGWDTDFFAIDNTKMYRYSVWIKKTNSTDGTTYFGCGANDILELNGAVHTNPYFWNGDLPLLNRWYLLVGYVHGSSDPTTSSYGGIYDGETGAKVASTQDFKFSPSATTARHRTYLYYDVTVADRQYFYGPEVSKIDQPVAEYVLSIFNNGNSFFGGNVGVGTTSPLSKLHINSSIERETFRVYKQGNTANYLSFWQGTGAGAIDPIGTGQLYLGYDQSTNVIMGYTGAGVNSGNVGIGTPSPDAKLAVKGQIHAQEVKVDLLGSIAPPDYVFASNYQLPTLDYIKTYINQNKHLPEVPSAKEMEANGVNLGEMNMLLLKKIEELTLYVIEQNGKLADQQKQIEDLNAIVYDKK